MARLYRDAYGVPHVRATSVLDLARGQGFVTAQDRAWQLEHLRRRATGSAAEVLGRRLLDWDVLVRRTRIADTARRAFATLGAESQSFVSAYVDGVNAGLHADAPELQRLGIEPAPWEPWTPLAVFHAQHLLFAALPDKLWQHRARSVLGDHARFLARDGAVTAGSNAWAVGGARAASGLPLVGGDPHRVIESPGVYAQVRLVCESPDGGDDFDVVGFTFPGVPGVQHFAHAGDVAWAITNACADYQDVFDESLDDVVESGEELVQVRGEDPVPVEVASTPRGPLFEIDRAGGRGLAVRDAATVLGDLGFDALLPLLRARTVDDVDAALDAWVEPGNNVVIADRDGTVRFRYAGRVPVHPDAQRHGIVASDDPDGGWTGWLDLPRHDVPPEGQVVTANERRGAESAPIGNTFAPQHRAQRLHTLLRGRDDLTPADFERFHDDTVNTAALGPVRLVRDLRPGPGGAQVQDLIVSWDGRMDADSAGAAAYAAWRTALTRRLVAEPAFADLRDNGVHGPVFAPYLDITAWVGLALETILAASAAARPFGIDVRRLATLALDDAVGHPATWGDTHVLGPTHGFDLGDDDLVAPPVPAVPVSGDIDCVRCTGSLPAITDECYRGSVARYVWDLSGVGASGWVVPMGASGDPRSPHHLDQLDAWAEGRLVPVVTDWDELTEVSGAPPPGGGPVVA
ncbi:penicillin acylase family protein [Nocardioides sp.]|uniref:penicillin acylase family protein n=1 Tax=Nocardioides sp. TaxID=35761 RepID=UPI001A342223|nr:penicillin acylase family protein [Nocardioides sp.]MBJ7356782.1 penicillin acylase family protein [Nocardioides sp.]